MTPQSRRPPLRRPLVTTSRRNAESTQVEAAADPATSTEWVQHKDGYEFGGDGKSVDALERQPTPCSDSEKQLKSDLVWLHRDKIV